MTDLVYQFDTSVALAGVVSFLRWQGNDNVIAGTAIDDGWSSLILSPQWVFYPKVPEQEIQRLPVGDRNKSSCLVWSIARDVLGTSYDVLQTIEQSQRTRPDRVVDAGFGLTYEIKVAWTYGRQALVAGAIGVAVQQ
jgi:hypothetical protein